MALCTLRFGQKKQPITARWNGRNGENDKTKTKKKNPKVGHLGI